MGRAEVCAVLLEAEGGGLAAAATRTGMGQNVVVTPVLELALGLAPGSAFRVREMATLLLPQLLSVEYNEFLPHGLQALLEVSI